MESASPIPSTRSGYSLKSFLHPHVGLMIWLVGFWLFFALTLCFADNRMNAKVPGRFAIDLTMICHQLCHAQVLTIFCVGFFSTRWSALFAIPMSIVAALMTIILFRVFNPLLFQDAWPFFCIYPAAFFLVCAMGRLFFRPTIGLAADGGRGQLSLVDIFLATFVVAIFLALLRMSIHDPLHAFVNDPKQIIAYHPEGTWRLMRAVLTAITGLAYLGLTKNRNSLLAKAFFVFLAVLFLTLASISVSLALWNLTWYESEKVWRHLRSASFNSSWFMLWFAVSIGWLRALGILDPSPPGAKMDCPASS